MKDLTASAADEAAAPIEVCFERLAEVERYPEWYPAGVKRAEVLERDTHGRASKMKATLSVSQGPIQRDFRLHLAVRMDHPRFIELRRLPKEPSDQEEMVVTWHLEDLGSERTRIGVDLAAKLDIPRLLPVGGIAETLARGFVGAAVDACG